MRKLLITLALIGIYAPAAMPAAQTQNDASSSIDSLQGQALQPKPVANAVPAVNANTQPVQPMQQLQQNLSPVAPAPQNLLPQSTMPTAQSTVTPGTNQAIPLQPRIQNTPINTNDTAGTSASATNQAFGQMINKVLPLTPDQIKALRVLFDQSQRAATARPIAIEPKPVISTQIVNFSPGSTPPFVRLAMGSVSSLVFVDSTGAKWPIASYAVPGAGKVYDVKCVDCGEEKDKQGNILLITPLVLHPDPNQGSNITVILRGLDTPISVKLFSDQPVIDYRADLHVPKMGPYAQPSLSTLPDKASPVLLNVLSGIPPNHSRAVKINGCDCQGWVLNNKLYLRSALPVISPGYISRMSSADGMNAYELPQVPIILASRHGVTVTLTVEGY